MPNKIFLVVEDGLTTQEMDDLRYLLTDALGEFAAKRTPAHDYVDNRYPGNDVYAGRKRLDKVAQVQRRIALAKKLHDATLSIGVRNDDIAQTALTRCRRFVLSTLSPTDAIAFAEKTALIDSIDQALVALL